MCTGKVIRVDSDKGWCYVACSKCGRKLQRIEYTFKCVRCNNSHAVGVLRYVELHPIRLYFSPWINKNIISYAYLQLPSRACNSWWHCRRYLCLFWWGNDQVAWSRSTCSWTSVGKFTMTLTTIFVNILLRRLLYLSRMARRGIPRTRICPRLLQAWRGKHTLSMSSWQLMISHQPINASLSPVFSRNMNACHHTNLTL